MESHRVPHINGKRAQHRFMLIGLPSPVVSRIARLYMASITRTSMYFPNLSAITFGSVSLAKPTSPSHDMSPLTRHMRKARCHSGGSSFALRS